MCAKKFIFRIPMQSDRQPKGTSNKAFCDIVMFLPQNSNGAHAKRESASLNRTDVQRQKQLSVIPCGRVACYSYVILDRFEFLTKNKKKKNANRAVWGNRMN